RPPPRSGISECFYSGGGASLFQRRMLQRLLAVSDAYAPFYWEDVEWGWRARKQRYRALFCADSVVHHRQRATVNRFYSQGEIESVVERNRVLFQLRNCTGCGSLESLFDEITRLPEPAVQYLLRPAVMLSTARVRLW